MTHSSMATASCCSSAATGGVGRLMPHERALVEMATTTKLVAGRFDNQARFAGGAATGMPYLIVEPELTAVARVLSFLDGFARVPVRMQKSSTGVGASLADISVGARAFVLRENFFAHAPAVTVLASLRMPTGASMKAEPMLSPVDATGTGSYLFSTSVVMEKEIARVSLSAGYGLSFEPDNFRNVALKPGLIHSPLVAAAIVPHDGGLLSVTWSMMFFGQPQFENRPLVDANKRKMTLAAGYSLTLHSHMKVNAQLGSDVPMDYLGKNNNCEAFLRMGLRFGVF